MCVFLVSEDTIVEVLPKKTSFFLVLLTQFSFDVSNFYFIMYSLVFCLSLFCSFRPLTLNSGEVAMFYAFQ